MFVWYWHQLIILIHCRPNNFPTQGCRLFPGVNCDSRLVCCEKFPMNPRNLLTKAITSILVAMSMSIGLILTISRFNFLVIVVISSLGSYVGVAEPRTTQIVTPATWLITITHHHLHSSPLSSYIHAQYYKHINDHWRTVQDCSSQSALRHTGRDLQ